MKTLKDESGVKDRKESLPGGELKESIILSEQQLRWLSNLLDCLIRAHDNHEAVTINHNEREIARQVQEQLRETVLLISAEAEMLK